MTKFSVRSSAFTTFFSLILLSILVPTGSNLNAARPANSAKVTICHRTSSVTNPYRRITVKQSSVVPQNQNSPATSKHGSSSGAHNKWSTTKFPNATEAPSVNVFDPTFTYPANDKNWGDIVPNLDVSGNPFNYGNGQAVYPGMNFTGDGLAIYNGTGNFAGLCKSISTKEFIESEKADGKTDQEIVDEINEQESDDDKPVLDALGGGPLTLQTLALVDTVGAITNEPTGITSSTGTLNGEFNLAPGKTATSTRFVWGTNPNCATGTTTSNASPSSATTGVEVSFDATGLTAGTTYYYKVVGTVDAGLDDEAEVEGDCTQFRVAQGLPSDEPTAGGSTAGGSTAGGSTAGGGTVVGNLPATGASLRLEVLATLTTMIGLALVAVRRRRII